MKITCLMMQKNEQSLLEPWILYHGLHFGFENLYIYDNGSDNQKVIEALKKFEAWGVKVNWKFPTKSDFENKGYIFSEKIKQLDETSPSDFYFPLDCDEFIVVENSIGCVSVDTLSILSELSNYVGHSAPLAIGTAYDNNPISHGYYYRAEGQRKTFFSKGTCWTLDLGFHDGKTQSGEAAIKTRIAYVHYHYKPFSEYAKSAIQKLEGRVKNFSKSTLEQFSSEKLAGFHLVGALLGGRDKYYQNHYSRFKRLKNSYYHLNSFEHVISKLGLVDEEIDPNLINAFDKKIPTWKGYVDSIQLTKNGFILVGWIVSLYDFDYSSVVLSIDGRKYKLAEISSYERKDVKQNVPFSKLDSGIKMFFSGKKNINASDIRQVEIYFDDYGTRFDFSFSGKIIEE